ncbi:hypothetical protein A2U01_0039997 [Trifolium medium]|uniref:Secreted protein n=1 Tax=Trifolium medium TaxID=97028 RepID=A0A392Q4J9_9FABA|nr:hypothetical protein [Trifolium medium]
MENKLSVMLLLMSRPALIWFHNPACCQQLMLRGQRNSTSALSSSLSSQIAHCNGHCTPRLFSLAHVGSTLRPILHSKFFTFSGILACQMRFQFPAIPVLF